MQKLMSFVLSATMLAYMACAETPQKNADCKVSEKSNTETVKNQTEEIAFIPENNKT